MDKLFIDEETLLTDAYRLGVKIHRSGFRPTFIIGVWRGGSTVAIAVQECLQFLGVEADHQCLRTSYRGYQPYQDMLNTPDPDIRVHNTHYLLENLGAEDRLLIVDDVCATGLNLHAIISRLRTRLRANMPREVRLAVVWNKPTLNRTDRQPDFFIHETDRWLVLPYELNGLTLDEIRAHKPFLTPILESCLEYLER